MKTLIFSDSHLTESFDTKHYLHLKKIIEQADFIVINGDFWDENWTSYDKFMKSEWNRSLFTLLKSKNTVYIHGNHDPKESCDDRVNLFSNRQEMFYRLKVGEITLYITHGQLCVGPLNFLHKLADRHLWFGRLCGIILEAVIRLTGVRLTNIIYRKMNNEMKEWAKNNLKQNEILVCGHSHLAEFTVKDRFINTGFNHLGYSQYLFIDDEKMELVKEKY